MEHDHLSFPNALCYWTIAITLKTITMSHLHKSITASAPVEVTSSELSFLERGRKEANGGEIQLHLLGYNTGTGMTVRSTSEETHVQSSE